MPTPNARSSKLPLALALTVIGTSLQAATSTVNTGPTAGTNSIPALPSAEIPQSIFIFPSSPKEGRNPFFPQATIVAPPTPRPNAPMDTSAFILNGITSPPKRTAMINGSTFEPGEEHEIKLPDGKKVLIKCEEIKADSAVIRANGVRIELRLRFGL